MSTSSNMHTGMETNLISTAFDQLERNHLLFGGGSCQKTCQLNYVTPVPIIQSFLAKVNNYNIIRTCYFIHNTAFRYYFEKTVPPKLRINDQSPAFRELNLEKSAAADTRSHI